MSTCNFGRVDARSAATFACYFLISLTAAAGSCIRSFAAETRLNAKPSSPLATMSERVGPPGAARGISLKHFAARRDSGLAVNLGSTMGANVVGNATVHTLDAPLATPRPIERSANLEAAVNHRGFWGSDQTRAQGARRGMLQAGGVATTTPAVMKFGLSDGMERIGGSEASPLSRGRETNAYAVNPTVAAMGGVHRTAVFSAEAVVEPLSQAMPVAANTQLFFSSEPVNGPLQPIGRPLGNDASLINRAR